MAYSDLATWLPLASTLARNVATQGWRNSAFFARTVIKRTVGYSSLSPLSSSLAMALATDTEKAWSAWRPSAVAADAIRAALARRLRAAEPAALLQVLLCASTQRTRHEHTTRRAVTGLGVGV